MSASLVAVERIKNIHVSGGATHSEHGTVYSQDAIQTYSHKRGFELYHFLDRHIFKVLDGFRGKKIVDLGCGAAPHSIYAAQQGAEVEAFDVQPTMIQEAQAAILHAGVSHQITAKVIESDLPYMEPRFDHALSINVGCNLPASIFPKHFFELSRVLQKNATATIAAPCSLDIVFTDGVVEEEQAQKQIQTILSDLPEHPSSMQIKDALIQLKHVLSATFVERDGRLVLVTPKMKLVNGQPIWRKITNCVIPNYYHPELEYEEKFEDSSFKVVEIEKHVIAQGKENLKEDHKLGVAYENYAPFVIYHLKKA